MIITAKEAAEKSGLSIRSIYAYKSLGRGWCKHFKKSGEHLVIDEIYVPSKEAQRPKVDKKIKSGYSMREYKEVQSKADVLGLTVSEFQRMRTLS